LNDVKNVLIVFLKIDGCDESIICGINISRETCEERNCCYIPSL